MNIAIILSGGTGTRIRSDIPKQYMEVEGHTMIADCLQSFFGHPKIDAVQVVAHESWHAFIRRQAEQAHRGAFERRRAPRRRRADDGSHLPDEKFRGFSAPGTIRALSIVNALRDLKETAADDDIVIIHDAARPFVSADLISRLIEAASAQDGAMPALSMKDTVYLLPEQDGAWRNAFETADVGMETGTLQLLPRARVVAGQAPEAFRFGKYLEANEALMPEKILAIKGSSEVAVLQGMDIVVIEGEETDFKITSDDDLARYRVQLRKEDTGKEY
ncbi:MAG: 2-C-methyl-D-erythritol 4-phosphate cytidylyltransferase [Lachnospiraceae bacterium]|nr:2-C-methyl-D-erythritol 4-phosphate cytidylyltransferase [Lachnospiraceae bacterium]